MINPFQHYRRLLQRWLPSPRRVEQRLGGISELSKGFGRVEWVLSRGLCRFNRFDLQNIPISQRRQALALQIQQWSPFAHIAMSAIMAGDAALVWVWDRRKAEEAVSSLKLNLRSINFVPEPLLHPLPNKDGQRLVACLDGFEGQIWEGGVLLASRWWPEAPQYAAWCIFLRDAGKSRDDYGVPPTDSGSLLAQTWAKPLVLDDAPISRYESHAVLGVGILLAGLGQWSLASLFQATEGIAQQQKRLETIEEQVKPIHEARSETLSLLEEIEFLRSLSPYPSPVLLLAEAGKRIPKDDTYIREWDYQNGRLRIIFGNPHGNLQASTYVKNFLDSGWFDEVQSPSANERNSLVLEMQVKKLINLAPELLENPVKDQSVMPANPVAQPAPR